VVGSLTIVPWLAYLLPLAASSKAFWTPRPDLSALGVTVASWQVTAATIPWGGAVAVAGAALATLGLLTLWFRPREPGANAKEIAARRRVLLIVVAAALSLVPVVWVYSQVRSIYDSRYMAGLVPFFALAVASGSDHLVGFVGQAAPGRRTLYRLGALGTVGLVVGGMLLASVGTVDADRADEGLDAGRQAAAQLMASAAPGDVIVALDARTYFPLRYYLGRDDWLTSHDVRLLEWHQPGEAFYAGWQDIEPADRLEPATVECEGWPKTAGLDSGATIWVVSITDAARETADFETQERGLVLLTSRIDVSGQGRPGVIRGGVAAGSGTCGA